MKTTNHVKDNESGMLPYPVIAAAVKGDVQALDLVLRHYEGYIAALSTRTLYDRAGNSYLCVDDELRRRLELKLITRTLAFKIA